LLQAPEERAGRRHAHEQQPPPHEQKDLPGITVRVQARARTFSLSMFNMSTHSTSCSWYCPRV
jgi:hypothetical protein